MKIAVLIIGSMLAVSLPMSAATARQDVFSELTAGFDLLSADGAEISLSSYRGKNVLLAFGFTHCRQHGACAQSQRYRGDWHICQRGY
jgi:cytochrome oxidase Cu insertion factor (SCO1/SenC/PrrC family)